MSNRANENVSNINNIPLENVNLYNHTNDTFKTLQDDRDDLINN
jgi:hypothetical protein